MNQLILSTPLSPPPPPCPNNFPPSPSFYALGDSFSAGIGANCGWVKDSFDTRGTCLKCAGAYPYVVLDLFNSSSNPCFKEDWGKDGGENMTVYHLGCTGASMSDIVSQGWNNRTSQLELMESVENGTSTNTSNPVSPSSNSHVQAPEPEAEANQGPGWGTLSIGGNDVGFADIVADCIMFDRPACSSHLNYTESLLSSPFLLHQLIDTYTQILKTARNPDFKLVVTSYSRFFNEKTEICDNKYIFYGRYLTREFRRRINNMVTDLNLVIKIAVSIVQLNLIFNNDTKMIFFEDWDVLLEGHRFCELDEKGGPALWGDAWFFTIYGEDLLPAPDPDPGKNGSVISNGQELGGGGMVDLHELAEEDCDRGIMVGMSKVERREREALCEWKRNLEKGWEPALDGTGDGKVGTRVYPWWITKTMHPKSVAHWELGKVIYKRWIEGEYF